MAKKKRKEVKKEEEEDYEFVPPEFDERAFLEKDIRGTKTLLVTAAAAVLFGLLGFALSTVEMVFGFIALLGGLILLRYLYPLVKIPVEDLERKSLIGNYLLFFLLFLGIWVLTINPPISDMADPGVEGVDVWYMDEDTYVLANLTQSTFDIPDDGVSLNISAEVVDNGEVDTVTIKLYEIGQESSATTVEMSNVDGDMWEHAADVDLTPDDQKTTYFFVIEAEDEGGNSVSSGTYQLS